MVPLVTVGIPTYNRPEGLIRTLDAITSQTFKNIEIIVSDNCSENEMVKKVIDKFKSQDPRIISFTQEKNIGVINNFKFVLQKASGSYFIWAADDDEWQGSDFLETLLKFSSTNALVFPDAILLNRGTVSGNPLKAYELCESKGDYSRVFCSDGAGYPVYGLYNLKLFYDLGLEFKFENDLAYYQEGIFLHKLFLKAPVKYVKEAKIIFDTNSIKPSYDLLLDSFIKYFKRTILIYSLSDLSTELKSELINIILENYVSGIQSHLQKTFITNQSSKKLNGMKRIIRVAKNLSKWKPI